VTERVIERGVAHLNTFSKPSPRLEATREDWQGFEGRRKRSGTGRDQKGIERKTSNVSLLENCPR
jgi:hypothetical protein